MKIKTKHCRFIATILVVTVILLGAYASNKDKVKIAYLTCDYQTNPLLVSSQTPSFGWQLMSVENNDVQQSAYAIATFLSIAFKY